MIKLGDEVIDPITEFTGIVTCICSYLEGSTVAYVQPMMVDYGILPLEQKFEINRLKAYQNKRKPMRLI